MKKSKPLMFLVQQIKPFKVLCSYFFKLQHRKYVILKLGINKVYVCDGSHNMRGLFIRFIMEKCDRFVMAVCHDNRT